MKWAIALKSATLYNCDLGIDSFNIIKVLGRGFYGKVMLVSKKDTGELFALKSVHKSRLIKSKKINIPITELKICKNIKHPFIVGLHFAFQSATKFYIGLEYIPGGDLMNLLTRKNEFLQPDSIKLYIAEIALAINHLHSNGIIYRDLKPENILISADGNLKLTDFGLSKDVSLCNDQTSTLCGTLEYLAPEILKKEKYSFEVDWWALGVITYELFYKITPFYHRNKENIIQSILNSPPKFSPTTDISVIDFISSLLTKDPKKRGNLETLKYHKFWGNLDLNKVLNKEYQPLFIPCLKSPIDVKYFDPSFTRESPSDSPATPIIGSKSLFSDFDTIVPNSFIQIS